MKKIILLVSFSFPAIPFTAQTNDSNKSDKKKIAVSQLTDIQNQNLLIEKELNETLQLRNDMLLAHEVTGWVTVGLMNLNTFVTTPELVGDGVHTGLGIGSGVLYFTTAGLSIFTPKLHDDFIILGGEKENTNVFIHKLLAFIHVPAMITTIVLGFFIEDDDDEYAEGDEGEENDLDDVHEVMSIVATTSFTLSAVITLFDF